MPTASICCLHRAAEEVLDVSFRYQKELVLTVSFENRNANWNNSEKLPCNARTSVIVDRSPVRYVLPSDRKHMLAEHNPEMAPIKTTPSSHLAAVSCCLADLRTSLVLANDCRDHGPVHVFLKLCGGMLWEILRLDCIAVREGLYPELFS